MLNEFELTGRAASHVEQRPDLGAALHRDIVESYVAMRDAAADDGITLQIVSGFRDFAAQVRIWNAKFRGDRPLYDESGNIVDHNSLDIGERISRILCWSALPGASRHHWGTDVDVIDRAAMPDHYRYQLLPQEYAPGGMFHALHSWLAENMAHFGFFRPYIEYSGGICPEPWHLSHSVISCRALQALTEDLIARTVADSDVLGKEHIIAKLPDIYRRYVLNIASPSITEKWAQAGN